MGKDNSERDLRQSPHTDRRVSKDWAPFAQNLTQVLVQLEEDQFLILTAKQGNRFLQFSCQGVWGMRIEVASNHYLKDGDRLTRQEMAWLRKRGWNAPTGTPKQATPDKDPDGSPNYFIDVPTSVSVSDIVGMVIDTLIHGLGLPYPGAMNYESFDSARGPLAFHELGLKPATRGGSRLMDQVLTVFQKVTGLSDLSFDDDGDLNVRYGEIHVSAVSLDNRVRLFSALMSEVVDTPDLLRKINQTNDGVHRIRFFWHENVVYASLDVPADPFVPEHLVSAMSEFSEIAEGMAIVLRAEFSGKAIIEPSGRGPSLQ